VQSAVSRSSRHHPDAALHLGAVLRLGSALHCDEVGRECSYREGKDDAWIRMLNRNKNAIMNEIDNRSRPCKGGISK
jgi:hypothetical protein